MARLGAILLALVLCGCSSDPEMREAPRCLGATECDGQCVDLQASRLHLARAAMPARTARSALWALAPSLVPTASRIVPALAWTRTRTA